MNSVSVGEARENDPATLLLCRCSLGSSPTVFSHVLLRFANMRATQ